MTKASNTTRRKSPMPTSGAARAILDARARRLAIAKKNLVEETTRAYFLSCRLGSRERYGIAYQYLDEVLYATGLAKVPATPSHIGGVLNRRGHLLTVLDLRPLMGIRALASGQDARVVVVHEQNLQLGILVDAVVGYQDFISEAMAPPLAGGSDRESSLIAGIYDGTVAMLDIPSLFHQPELVVD